MEERLIIQIPEKDIAKEITWIEEIGEYLVHNDSGTFLVPLICRHEGIPLPRLAEGETCVKCHRHGWILDIKNQRYINPVGIDQQQSSYRCIKEQDVIYIYGPKSETRSPLLVRNDEEGLLANKIVEAYFINHACFLIKHGLSTLVTDPWLIGSAFCTGWFLKYPTRSKDISEVLRADHCYISHSHPDHLNPLTLLFLKKLGWDPLIIIPKFPRQDLTAVMLRQLGYNKIVELENKETYCVGSDSGFTIQMILDTSGRNDSSILVNANNNIIFNQVDSSSPDIEGLRDVDIALLPFANGASGFPVCWEKLLGRDQIAKIKTKSNLATLTSFHQRALTLKAAFVIPFAGYFKTPLAEDAIIDGYNIKNAPEDTVKARQSNTFVSCQVIDPSKDCSFRTDRGLCFNSVARNVPKVEDSLFRQYRELIHTRYSDFSHAELIEFLSLQGFRDSLIVRFTATEIDHDSPNWTVDWDFVTNRLLNCYELTCTPNLDLSLFPGHRFLEISVRRYALGYTIRNSLPWEEFSIGFQARFFRKPDVYNLGFWDYFQNNYKYKVPVLSDFIDFWRGSDSLQSLCSSWIDIDK